MVAVVEDGPLLPLLDDKLPEAPLHSHPWTLGEGFLLGDYFEE